MDVSPVEHLFVFLQIHLQLLVLLVFSIDWGNVPHVPDSSMVVSLELLLVGLDLFAELSSFGFYFGYHCFDLFLRHLFSSSLCQCFLQFLVINVKRTQRFFLLVVWLFLEIAIKIVVVVLQLIFDLFLLVCKAIDSHRVNILFEFHLPIALHQRFLKPQFLKSLFESLWCLLVHPLCHIFVLDHLRLVGGGLPGCITEYRKRIILMIDATFSGVVLLSDESLQFFDLGLALNGQ